MSTAMATRKVRTVTTRQKTGPKTILTEEVLTKLHEAVKEGKEITEVSKTLGIPYTTIYTWKASNYLGLKDKWTNWELEAKLLQAEAFSKKLLEYTATRVGENGKEYIDSRLLAVQQREAEYLRTTLLIAKSKYDAKQSQTVNIVLPTPIMDLGNVVSTVEHKGETVEKEKVTGEGMPGEVSK